MGAVTSHTFTNVTANHTIAASFVQRSYAITVTQGAHGTIAPGTTQVACGTDQAFTITPDPGYHIADVVVDGISIGAVGSHTFTDVQAAHTHHGELRDQRLHDRGVGGPGGHDHAERRRGGGARGGPDVHDHGERVLRHRGRAGGRDLGGGGDEPHVHGRDGEPHDCGELRAAELRDHGDAGGARDDRAGDDAGGVRDGPGVHDHAGSGLPHRGRGGGRDLDRGGGEPHVQRRAGGAHADGELRDQQLHDRGVGGPGGHDHAERGRGGGLRGGPDVHHRGQRRIPHPGRAGGRQLGGGGGELHVHGRDGEPHDRGEVRDQHLHADLPHGRARDDLRYDPADGRARWQRHAGHRGRELRLPFRELE